MEAGELLPSLSWPPKEAICCPKAGTHRSGQTRSGARGSQDAAPLWGAVL
jgi:hypothetical protein